MLEGIMTGLSAAFTIQAILLVVLGCLIGSLIGMVPGLGPMQVIAIMIPVAIGIGDPSVAMIMLAGVYYGAVFGGSTSSILINAPGVASTVATSFDGYPMARKGLAGKALTIAAVSSFAGGTIGAILLTIAAKPLSDVALLFQSPEYFAVMILGMTAVAAFGERGRAYKAVLMLVFGMVLASIGEGSQFANYPRFTFGIVEIQDGISAITLIMGLFALPEAFFLILDKNRGRLQGDGSDKEIKEMRINGKEALEIAPVIGRQSIFGFLIGVMPGAGATIASLMGYAVERNLAPPEKRAEFGHGSVRGLSAPETANNAASTGSFVGGTSRGISTHSLPAAFRALDFKYHDNPLFRSSITAPPSTAVTSNRPSEPSSTPADSPISTNDHRIPAARAQAIPREAVRRIVILLSDLMQGAMKEKVGHRSY